jgi:general secretion pathway protein L
MPSEQRGARESRQERMTRMGLAWLALLLFIALLAVPIWRKREAVIALQPQLARAETEAKSTDTVAKEVERLVADYNFLQGRKYASYPALAYLEDLSRLLPDNTWLQQMDLKQVGRNREVTITGETPSSSKLIEILQQSKVLQNARTSGTVTRGSVPGTERFMITAEAMARPAPEARSALEGAPPPGAPVSAAPVPAAPVPAAPAVATPPAATPNPATPPTPAKVTPVPPPSGNAAPAPAPVPVKPSAQPAPALQKPQQVAPTQDNPYGAPWLQNVPKQPPKSK